MDIGFQDHSIFGLSRRGSRVRVPSAPPKNQRLAAEMLQAVFLCLLFAVKSVATALFHELVKLDDRQQHRQHDQHDHQAHRHDEQRLQNGGERHGAALNFS